MSKSPDAFRTISEVADWLETPAHVLRFWESKFAQVKPVKRAGGRRYYRRGDMALLGGLKRLLHEEGMTIKGAQALLREKGIKHVQGLSGPLDTDMGEPAHVPEAAPAQDQPADIQGLPPAELQDALTEEPAREWDLIEDPEVVDMSDVQGDADTGPLPFIHREPLDPAKAPKEDHFLQAASQTLDAHSPVDPTPETIPAPEPPPPAGPVRLDLLRQALASPGKFDPATLGAVRDQIADVRARLIREPG